MTCGDGSLKHRGLALQIRSHDADIACDGGQTTIPGPKRRSGLQEASGDQEDVDIPGAAAEEAQYLMSIFSEPNAISSTTKG